MYLPSVYCQSLCLRGAAVGFCRRRYTIILMFSTYYLLYVNTTELSLARKYYGVVFSCALDIGTAQRVKVDMLLP